MSDMSEVIQIARRKPAAAPLAPEAVTLPYTVELPTRYYSRLAVEETARLFEAIATVETRVGDGILTVTFKTIDPDAGEVIPEFLNHVLYYSATAGEEANR